MTIQQFQYVLAVVDLKNFEAAAEKCFVTQSTLSTMIGKLEDEIGIKIFNRNTKPVSITEEGQKIIERLRIIINEVDSCKNLIQELKGKMVGEFRIGIIPTIAPYLLPLILTEFASSFPLIQIFVKEMTTSQIRHALKIRTIDIGLLALPLDDKELEETGLYLEPFMLYDCSEEVSVHKVSIDNLDYSKLCLLQEGHCLHTQVRRICERSDQYSKRDLNFEFESGSIDSLLRITKIRQGITVIPYLAAIGLPESEGSHVVEFEFPVPVRNVGLVTNKFFVKKMLLKSLQEIIQKSVSSLIPFTEMHEIHKPL